MSETDPTRDYSDAEKEQLTLNLERIARLVHQGTTTDRPLAAALLRDFHAALFDGVRSHAGRFRAPGFGQEKLTFGPNHSAHRDVVAAELDRVF